MTGSVPLATRLRQCAYRFVTAPRVAFPLLGVQALLHFSWVFQEVMDGIVDPAADEFSQGRLVGLLLLLRQQRSAAVAAVAAAITPGDSFQRAQRQPASQARDLQQGSALLTLCGDFRS